MGPPPKWLRAKVARLLADRGRVSGAWYTKTSRYRAQRVILQEEGGDPDRDVYLVLVRGDVTIDPELFPYLHAKEPAKWLIVEFDSASRDGRSIAAANRRPDTGEVEPLVSPMLRDGLDGEREAR